MIKYPLIALFAFFTLLSSSLAPSNPPTENQYVRFAATLKQKQPKAGATCQLLVSLQPQKGIHINLAPPISITLDSSDVLAAVGKLETPKMEKTAYLDTSRPIVLPFTLSKKLKPGNATIKGTLTYYYCSDADGWCSRFKQPLALTIMVSK